MYDAERSSPSGADTPCEQTGQDSEPDEGWVSA
jgi:hypothetical protein